MKKAEKKGFFICIEGPDKSGKTTQSRLLVEALYKNGLNAVYTTEPSEGEIGRFIRTYVLNRKQRLPVVVEALLFAADRVDHNENEIKPMLNEGKIVVSDRYVYSSLAYQGAAGLDVTWITEINRSALAPDLAIYLDVPVDVIFQRCEAEKSVMEHPDTQKRVKEVYLKLVQEGKMIPVDGTRPIEEVAKEVQKLVQESLKGSKHA
jgi:dTMP kinase